MKKIKHHILPPGTPRGFRVPITKQVIDAAVRNSSAHCMVADGIREGIPGAESVVVEKNVARFNKDGFRYAYMLSAEVLTTVQDYDDNKKIPPWTLDLRKDRLLGLPMPVAKRGPRTSGRGSTKKRRAPKIVFEKRRYHGIRSTRKTVTP